MGQTHPEVFNTAEAASPATNFPTNFRLFVQKTGEPVADVLRRIEAFVAEAPRQAKSIGVEFLESKGINVFTLGYEVKNEASRIALTFAKIGNLTEAMAPSDGSDKLDIASLEYMMAEQSAKTGNAICHEISVDANGDLHMLVMSEAPAVVMTEPTAE